MLCSAKNLHFNISDETHMKMTPTEEIFEKTGTLHSKMLLSEFSNPFYCNKPELELNDSFLFFSLFFSFFYRYRRYFIVKRIIL